ncbi:MAG: cytochrome c oxidase subunit 3 [Sandarakinorhabdus sp.]|nr:cytochrome c oxidase subunit 3 [Sandarakinorhabdus sp.]
MAAGKTHDFHILNPSTRPILMSAASLVLAAGAIGWMHKMPWGMPVFFGGIAFICTMFFLWWKDVVHEANTGDHTPVVQLHHRYGMILFIASEVMFFVAWFWAFFNASLFPKMHEGIDGKWPPAGVEVLDPFVFPLLNTLILLLSGTTVTWAHHALIHGDRKGLKQGLLLTIILGMIFTSVQAFEYYHAEIAFSGNIYGSTFYMATGFHGFHVVVGTIFLMVCLARANRGDFTPQQHFGFEAAAWYWHFVDVVWLFLFVAIYVWGSNFGASVVRTAFG